MLKVVKYVDQHNLSDQNELQWSQCVFCSWLVVVSRHAITGIFWQGEETLVTVIFITLGFNEQLKILWLSVNETKACNNLRGQENI